MSAGGGGPRKYEPGAPELGKMLEEHDAGLLIGDPALRADRSGYFAYDLAEEWIRFTGKPFVFAFWAVREDAILSGVSDFELASIFQNSRDRGLNEGSLDRIARDWAPRVGLTEDEVHQYLTRNIHYELGPDCLEGLRLFYRYAEECGALPPAPKLRFLERARVPAS